MWHESEDLFECFIAPWHSGWQSTCYAAESHHEEVHGKSHPNDESRFAKSPYFGNDIVEDVRDREDYETAGEGYGTPYVKDLGLKKVRCHKADTEYDSHQHEGNACLMFLFHCYSCFLRGFTSTRLFFSWFDKYTLVFYEVLKHSESKYLLFVVVEARMLDSGAKLRKKNKIMAFCIVF